MEKYIRQLIEEIEDRIRLMSPPPAVPIPPEMEDCPEVAEYELAENRPAAEWIGLNIMQFPASDLLNPEQMKLISRFLLIAFRKLNIEVDLPKMIPVEDKYKLLRELLQEPVPYLSVPGFHFDFCSGVCDDCRIRKFCRNAVHK